MNTENFIRAGTLEELTAQGCLIVRAADRPVAVFNDHGTPRAVDNRCPHLGFPLSRGSIKDGIITCPWHNARFEASTGCTFDLWADDVAPYDVEIREGEIWVALQPRGAYQSDRTKNLLQHGLRQNLSLLQAKAILVFRDHPEKGLEAVIRETAAFAHRSAADWGAGLTILTAMANLLPWLDGETAYLALFQGVRHVAQDCAGRPMRQVLTPFDNCDVSGERLQSWLDYWVSVRHADAAERTLLTAGDTVGPGAVAPMVYRAASVRFYADGGHTFDFCNKALELLDRLTPEWSREIVPLLVRTLVTSRGGEESNAWRHPIDLVPLIRSAEERLPDALRRGQDGGQGGNWEGTEELADRILGEDPEAILEAILDAANAGARPVDLSKALAYAASLRLGRFGPTNELIDWLAALHTFTYSNAVHQALKRLSRTPGQTPDSGDPEPGSTIRVARAVLHGAMSVYLDRFLNVPPTRLPGERTPLTPLSEAPETALPRLLAHFDARQQKEDAARLVASYLVAGHPVRLLINTLARAVVREDADFHTFQMLEASVKQYEEWPEGSVPARNILVALTRYISAHSPTQRAAFQTAQTALRLHRGEHLHDEDAAPTDSA